MWLDVPALSNELDFHLADTTAAVETCLRLKGWYLSCCRHVSKPSEPKQVKAMAPSYSLSWCGD